MIRNTMNEAKLMWRSKQAKSGFGLLGCLVASLILSSTQLAAAVPLTESNVVRAVVGEAAASSYDAKRGVACAIFNRKTMRGVYGYSAAHNASEPDWVWLEARAAVQEGKQRDFVRGATHFGNKSDVRKGTFIGMTFVCALGAGRDTIYFFK